MPLYEFECESCGFEFEELSNNNDSVGCKKCGGATKKKMSSFSSRVPGSSNESIDVKIGREANKRWEMHHERQDTRRKGKELKDLEVPKVGKEYAPAMGLGSKEQRTQRKEYSVALQEHRKRRKKRGQKQFSETGPF
jgi:putative FmdB family regulatory protein